MGFGCAVEGLGFGLWGIIAKGSGFQMFSNRDDSKASSTLPQQEFCEEIIYHEKR